jgi:gamma-glutamyltranspeptidase/glutathione hydrolase
MIRTARGEVITIDGLGVWPSRIPADLFMREYGGMLPTGVLRTVVPAAPDAWIAALREYGTMSFAEIAAPAIRLASEGFAVFPLLAEHIAMRALAYARWPSNASIYLPRGRPPEVGERFVQTDLAATLRLMAAAESSAEGTREQRLEAARAVFYEGEIAERIVRYHAQHGGYLGRDDLASFRCRFEAPVSIRWRDLELFTCGPWCQGPTLAQALITIEAAGLDGLEHNGSAYVHLVIEALKGVFADREHYYGDPAFVEVPLERLLSAEHAAARAGLISREQAFDGLPPPLFGVQQPLPCASNRAAASHIGASGAVADADAGIVPGEAGTSYVCVVDRWGNAFSATPSDGASTSPVIPGTGIVPSLRGLQSRPDPAHPAGVAPGKRPRLTPNPAIAVGDDGAVMPLGCPGGDMQVQAMLQVLLGVFHFGIDLQQAINAPRFSTWSFPNSFAPFEYLPGRVLLEDRFDEATIAELERRGHDVRRWPPFTRDAAAVEAIVLDPATGFVHAAADPRQPASAIVG